mmetsp:Transcript_59115/g.125634  ORF Transcript_59115/g.125634 Transcript_59115/m.125634 type:complete len:101 (-) Transcript_59115:1055-1357(-)
MSSQTDSIDSRGVRVEDVGGAPAIFTAGRFDLKGRSLAPRQNSRREVGRERVRAADGSAGDRSLIEHGGRHGTNRFGRPLVDSDEHGRKGRLQPPLGSYH